MDSNVKEYKVTFRAYLLMAQSYFSSCNPEGAELFIKKAIVIHNLLRQEDVENCNFHEENQRRQDKLLDFKKALAELKGEPEPTE